jgi:hypothetical protein
MRHSNAFLTVPVAALALTLAVGACDDDDEPAGPGDSTTTLTVLLTDAPGSVEAVWVDISEVYLQGSEGPAVLLDEPTGLIELTELVGTTHTLVSEGEVDPAVYGQLRMVVTAAVLETVDGDVYVLGGAEHPDGLEATGTLQCPSCAQSGIKVKIPQDEVDLEEGAAALLLDFDVAQSFGHKAGNSGMWVMRPVIHGMLVEDANGDGIPDLAQTGSIEGTIELDTDVSIPECPAGTARDLTDFVPVATAQTLTDGDGLAIERAGSVSEGGGFIMSFVAPDTYTLGHQAELEFEGATLAFTADVAPTEVEVEDSEISGVNYTITAATCEVP